MLARKTFKIYNFFKVVLSFMRLAIMGGFFYFNIVYFESEYGIVSNPSSVINDTFSEDMFGTAQSTIIFSLYFGAAIVYNIRMLMLPFILMFLLYFSCCICAACVFCCDSRSRRRNWVDFRDSIYLFLSGFS
jgi:hypothetical protein